jgi:hypothetical protein
MMKRYLWTILATVSVAILYAAPAQAQATRTWVSGVGDDVNPCSRTAPCKTFAGAISKTATGGEISVLDPGGYGALTINKAITVDGGTGSGWGSTLFSSVNGFIINITTNLPTDKVILRNLSINGAGTTLGVNGIRFLDGASLTVENVHIFNFSGNGIDVAQSQACSVFLKNVKITNGAVGIKTQSTAGAVSGTFEDVDIDGMSSHGYQAVNNSAIVIKDMTTARCGGSGVRSEAASVNLSIENGVSSGNSFGFEATAGSVRIANCGMYYNNTDLTTNILSAGNNRSAGNSTTNTPTANGMTIH